ncbi:MAG: hypothetical protein V3T64_09225 [Myxococcota bacterium]
MPGADESRRIARAQHVFRFLKRLAMFRDRASLSPSIEQRYRTIQGLKLHGANAVCGCCARGIRIRKGKVQRSCFCHTYEDRCFMCGHCPDHCCGSTLSDI